MSKRILDTSVLVRYWRHKQHAANGPVGEAQAASWAVELRRFHDDAFLASPVVIEWLAGTTNRVELELYRSFVAEFALIDDRQIPEKDWETAQRIAERIPNNGKPRQLGDCLIAAIARRLKCSVISLDQGFPK